MKVPSASAHLRRTFGVLRAAGLFACLAGVLSATAAGPKPNPSAPLILPAESFGYRPISALFAAQGGTEFTLHFVDETHLLFTFGTRALMPRLADANPEDQDRTVAAVLLELPTGRVLARTQWRTRDHDKYLWPLGRGRFLLRIRSRLTLLDPLQNLAEHGPEEAFHQQEIVTFKRAIAYVSVSPLGDLLGVETIPPRKAKLIGGAASAAALAATVPGYKPDPPPAEQDVRPPVQIFFYRLVQGKDVEGQPRLSIRAAGLIGAPNLIELPATGEGYLEIAEDNDTRRGWLFDFVTHTGARTQLSGYETSCAPRPFWISRSEFVAFGCNGSKDRQQLSYFNLKGEQPWLQMLRGTHVSPIIISAPEAGRLALGRTLVNNTIFEVQDLTPDLLDAQEITVLQAHDGRTLLKVFATPIQRAGQNFDLSATGLHFAVFRGGNLEVYPLPRLTARDASQVKAALEMAPQPNTADVRLNSQPMSFPGGREEEAPAEAPSVAEGASTPNAAAPPAIVHSAAQPEVHIIENGDTQDTETGRTGPRKPPTLYSGDGSKPSDQPVKPQ